MKSDGKNRNVLFRPVDATRGGEDERKEGKGMGASEWRLHRRDLEDVREV